MKHSDMHLAVVANKRNEMDLAKKNVTDDDFRVIFLVTELLTRTQCNHAW